jgi:ACS family hexuronate transporter-like MFS transporter
VWIPFVAADLANLVTGWVALILQRRGWSVHTTRKAIMLVGALMSQIGIAAPFSHSLFWTMTFLSVAVFFWMAWSITVQTLPGDIFPPRAVASVYGIGASGAMLGVMFSIFIIGRVLDATHSYRNVFTLLGLLMPLAFLLGTILIGRIRPLEFEIRDK